MLPVIDDDHEFSNLRFIGTDCALTRNRRNRNAVVWQVYNVPSGDSSLSMGNVDGFFPFGEK